MRKRGLCCRPVSVRCPSVCLSVRHVRDGQTDSLKIPSNFFLVPIAPSLYSSFWPQAPLLNSKGNPFSGGVKYTMGGKSCDFRLKSPFISETVRYRPMVAIRNVNRNSQWRIDPYRFRWPGVTLKSGRPGVNIFRRISLITLEPRS